MSLTIWTNAHLTEASRTELIEGVKPHRLVLADSTDSGSPGRVDIVFGQPDPVMALGWPHLRWIHVSAAGYSRYDGAEFREPFAARGGVLTNSSSVYDEPCAEQVLAWMLAQGRQIPQSLETQRTTRAWPMHERRAAMRLLRGESAVILGYGAIGRRLAEMLATFQMKVTAVRRGPAGDENVVVVREDGVAEALAGADHVIDILPENNSTHGYVNAARLNAMKPGAIFYNIGRGSTVDQEALLAVLQSGHLGGAYLDVTSTEPLPPEHPLWTAPNCYITPHAAGGHADEPQRLVRHFIENLRRFERGEDLWDRVM